MPELRAHTPTDDIQIKSNIPGKTSCRRRVQPDPVDYFQCDCTKLSLPDGYVAQTVTPRMHSDICCCRDLEGTKAFFHAEDAIGLLGYCFY